MNSSSFRRIGVIAGAAVITTVAFTSGSVASGQPDGNEDRPCFMVRSHWNTAEGPQPTCPVPMWQTAASSESTDASTSRAARTVDFMP